LRRLLYYGTDPFAVPRKIRNFHSVENFFHSVEVPDFLRLRAVISLIMRGGWFPCLSDGKKCRRKPSERLPAAVFWDEI
jgi:hypothetical protein